MRDDEEWTIWTIGHSYLDMDEFLDLLNTENIELLVDVRSYPASRWVPHFGKESLLKGLKTATIKYEHLETLGGRQGKQRLPEPSPNEGWTNASFKDYADYTLTKPAIEGFRHLIELARNYRVAYMCAEAVPWRCHRRIISDVMVGHGWTVQHIMKDGSLEEHELGAWGPMPHYRDVLIDGQYEWCATYPPEQPALIKG